MKASYFNCAISINPPFVTIVNQKIYFTSTRNYTKSRKTKIMHSKENKREKGKAVKKFRQD